MNIWKIFKNRTSHCRTCKYDGIYGEGVKNYPELNFIKQLKFGSFYRCSKCGTSWFYTAPKNRLSRVYHSHLSLFERWSQEHFMISDTILSILSNIGGTMNYDYDYISIPCIARDISGQIYEKSIILISQPPPYHWPGEPQLIHWANELAAVAPSPFALPLKVRQASAEKKEVSMGFAPVDVADDAGNKFILGHESTFFDYEGVKGKDLHLSEPKQKWWQRRQVIYPSAAEAYYFVDWFDGCEEMLVNSQSR